jgi:hypothetical protein
VNSPDAEADLFADFAAGLRPDADALFASAIDPSLCAAL